MCYCERGRQRCACISHIKRSKNYKRSFHSYTICLTGEWFAGEYWSPVQCCIVTKISREFT